MPQRTVMTNLPYSDKPVLMSMKCKILFWLFVRTRFPQMGEHAQRASLLYTIFCFTGQINHLLNIRWCPYHFSNTCAVTSTRGFHKLSTIKECKYCHLCFSCAILNLLDLWSIQPWDVILLCLVIWNFAFTNIIPLE